MVLVVQNMVSRSCVYVVKTVLERLNIKHQEVRLGEIVYKSKVSDTQISEINKELEPFNLKVVQNDTVILIERIKIFLNEYLSNPALLAGGNRSLVMSRTLDYNYTYLSNLFSKNTGITIEQYFINMRINRIKELLLKHKMSVTDIAYQLKFSSVSHLSQHFKKHTNLTPSEFLKFENKIKHNS